MTVERWLLVWILLTSLVSSVWIFRLKEESCRLRTMVNLGMAALKLLLVCGMIWGVTHEQTYEFRHRLLAGLDIVLKADALAVLFVTLSTVLWLVTTVYAIGYLEDSPHRSRFFGFFSLCVCSTVGLALSGNLFTFLLFFELLTISTYPLVVHRGTDVALRSGRMYLAYTLIGGGLVMLAVIWLRSLTGTVEFSAGGAISGLGAEHRGALVAIFWLFIAGLGVKAALVPLHGWLPNAMVAPAPVSALLHAVAVVKAGAFGIVRIYYDVFGVDMVAELNLALPLALIASVTIVYGSIRAVFQDDLKKRLAFSTVSQVSYVILGTALMSPIATIGGLVHLVHQGLMKITLFFCAGNFAEGEHIHKISEMNGIGRRMPATMAAFSLAAFGMIGVPPMAGFISKWYLGLGGLAADAPWALGVLMLSSALNAVYFLPILYRAWFVPADENVHGHSHSSAREHGRWEIHWMLLFPPLITVALALLAGLLASAPFSPLTWARLIAQREYGISTELP